MIKYLDLKAINQLHDAEIRAAISGVLDSGWYLKGEATRQFEQHYAEYIGTKYCIGCANGLDALTLIFRAYIELGVIQKGDEVIVPANTYIASILAITECGLTPVLIVHLYGRCAYTDRIGDICRQHHLKLIEDNAQAHGCTHPSLPLTSHPSHIKRTGSLAHAAAHSFYPGKNLGALGDAGAVTTSDEVLAEVVRAIGNYGSSRKYVFDYLGRNSRIDELQAAILDIKIKYLDEENKRRKEIAALYINNVTNPLIRMPKCGDRDCVWHIFPVLCEHRDRLQQYLKDNGVETQIHYPIPPHKQRCYSDWNNLSFPITEQIHAQELSIPCHQAMTKKEVDEIINLLNSFTLATAE